MPMRGLLRRLIRNERGAVAVEMAIVGPPFLLTLLSIVELGLILTTQALLDGATRDAARAIRTGQIFLTANNSETAFQNILCTDMGTIMNSVDCKTNLVINVVSVKSTNFSQINFNNCCTWNPGGGGDVVGVQISYQRPFIIPWVGTVLSINNSQKVPIVTTVVFRNEPFS
jgi:Flp pilus assembly protein TadG